MSLLTEAYDRYSEHTALDGEGIELAMEFELAAMECGADPSWDRQRLVRFERARKGGLATLARYGRAYYRALARVRWGKTSRAILPAIRDALYIPEEPQVAEPRSVPASDTPGSREEIAA
jgi:hypothetical protein